MSDEACYNPNSYFGVQIQVMREIDQVLNSITDQDVNKLISLICDVFKRPTGKVCGFGAGRMGYGLRAFMMRLNHLGIPAYFIGDTFIPPLDENDIFIVTSGSGETRSVLKYLEIAKEKGVRTLDITGNRESTMAKLADYSIVFKSSNGGLNSADNENKINSIQPMTSLNEQSMFIFFDIISVMLIRTIGIKKEDEKKFHFNVE